MQYIYTDLPIFVKITPRSATSNAVIPEGGLLLFSEDGSTVTTKDHTGSYTVIGGSGIDPSSTTATAADVLAGKLFFTSGGSLASGTIPTVSAVSSGSTVSISSGYLDSAVSIVVSGGVDVSDTTAAPADVLSGKLFHDSTGALVSGGILTYPASTFTPTTSAQYIPAGVYLGGSQTIAGDPALVGSNLISGTSIFGVSGTIPVNSGATITPGPTSQTISAGQYLSGAIVIEPASGGVDVSDTTAAPADVLSGKLFHDSTGALVSGGILTYPASTFTPGTTAQYIPAGVYLGGSQTIAGDPALVGSNIISGASIFGVSGTASAGGGGGGGYFECVSAGANVGYLISAGGDLDGQYVPDGVYDSKTRWARTSGSSAYLFQSGNWTFLSYDSTGATSATPAEYQGMNGSVPNWKVLSSGGVSMTIVPENLSSGAWTGYPLVLSGGYYQVNSSGPAQSLIYSGGIVPEAGKCYSTDGLVVLADYWRANYGQSIDAMVTAIADDLGSWSYYEGVEDDGQPDENGWFWFPTYAYAKYSSPGDGQEHWDEEGGTGKPWIARRNSFTVKFDYQWTEGDTESTIFDIPQFRLFNDNGTLGKELSYYIANWSITPISASLAANTEYTFIIIFDHDYCWVILNGAVVGKGYSMEDSTAITELSIGRSDKGGRMGIKNLKMWGRAMRNFIPANA